MSVIRSGSAAHRPLFLSIKDAEEEARHIVASAKERAAIEANSARAEGFERGRREGYHAGMEEGRRQGATAALEETREKLEFAVEALSNAALQLEAAKRSLQEHLPRDCAELSLAVARRIIKRQVDIDPKVLEANLEHAVKLVIDAKSVRIAFHPDDRHALDSAIQRLRLSCPAVGGAKLVEDNTLSRGGCRVYMETGMIDADLDSQLDRLIEQLIPGSGDQH